MSSNHTNNEGEQDLDAVVELDRELGLEENR